MSHPRDLLRRIFVDFHLSGFRSSDFPPLSPSFLSFSRTVPVVGLDWLVACDWLVTWSWLVGWGWLVGVGRLVGAGRLVWIGVRCVWSVPQVCLLFGFVGSLGLVCLRVGRLFGTLVGCGRLVEVGCSWYSGRSVGWVLGCVLNGILVLGRCLGLAGCGWLICWSAIRERLVGVVWGWSVGWAVGGGRLLDSLVGIRLLTVRWGGAARGWAKLASGCSELVAVSWLWSGGIGWLAGWR